MPKKTLVLDKFDGGINTDVEARDIADNEFAWLEGLRVDNDGVLKMMGGPQPLYGENYWDISDNDRDYIPFPNSDTGEVSGVRNIYWNNGLFAYSSDKRFDGLTKTYVSDMLVSTDYSGFISILYATGGNEVYDWNKAAIFYSNWGVDPAVGFSTQSSTASLNPNNELSFYAPDGNLRIGDYNGSSNSIPWGVYGIPGRKLSEMIAGTASAQYAAYSTYWCRCSVGEGGWPSTIGYNAHASSGWHLGPSYTEYGIPSKNLRMINLGSRTKGIIETSSGDDDITSISISNVVIPASVFTDGGGFGTLSTVNDYYNGMTCSFFTSSKAHFGVVQDYSYAGGNGTFTIRIDEASDLDEVLDISTQEDLTVSDTDVDPASGGWGFQVGQQQGYMWNEELDGDERVREVKNGAYGVTLSYESAGNSGDGGWMPTTKTRYKFYFSTMYDRNQESAPRLFTMHPMKFASGTTKHETAQDMYFNELSENGNGNNALGTATDNVSMSFQPIVRLKSNIGASHDSSESLYPPLWPSYGTTYNANYPTGTNISNYSSIGYYNFGGNMEDYLAPYYYIQNNPNRAWGNHRITGGRIYWASNEDGYTNLYLMFDLDWEKGCRSYSGNASNLGGDGGASVWKSFIYNAFNYPMITPDFSSQHATFTDPPKIETFESLNGYSHESKTAAIWKTAVVANGRTYIGGIRRAKKSSFNDGDGMFRSTTLENYPDRICKSLVGKYDTFPEENDLELFNSDDGDSVIHLDTFADRLLVFKRKSVHIINISKDIEILEGSYPNLGLDGNEIGGESSARHVCNTDFGVAWMNSNGVYLFDGNTIKSLTDGKIKKAWTGQSNKNISAPYGTDTTPLIPFYYKRKLEAAYPVMSYDPRSKKLLCVIGAALGQGLASAPPSRNIGDTFFYNFLKDSWEYKGSAFGSFKDDNENVQSGVINKYFNIRFAHLQGRLVCDDRVELKTWDDGVPQDGQFYDNTDDFTRPGVVLLTKDFDFGSPAVKKKIYKVYITYQSGGETTNMQVYYGVNGDALKTTAESSSLETFVADKTFKDGTNFTSNELDAATGWTVAELKPSTSSEANNVYSFQLKMTTDGGEDFGERVPKEFEINDITIVYREKSVK